MAPLWHRASSIITSRLHRNIILFLNSHLTPFLTPLARFSTQDPQAMIEPHWNQKHLNPHFSYSRPLQKQLYGRHLLRAELDVDDEVLEAHLDSGYVKMAPGIVRDSGRPICLRCGNTQPHLFSSYHCYRCQKQCIYCRQCITMGVVKACTPLYTWSGPPVDYGDQDFVERFLQWGGSLTKAQQRASDQLVNAVARRESFLIWAVCGAGKTEVLYQALEYGLQRYGRQAIVSPRVDVIMELSPRFQSVFPDVDFISLYGGSQDEDRLTPLTLATVHQLLRFYQAFDVIYVDEVDAYPFHNNPFLRFALEKARKPDAPIVYLSATPDRQLKDSFQKGRVAGTKIPLRYHGHPLPVPTFRWLGNWQRQLRERRLGRSLHRWLMKKVGCEHPIFMFVPTIAMAEILAVRVRQVVDQPVACVHSETPGRRAMLEQFKAGDISILVTTTILERGVTVSRADVAVFGADDTRFDEKALVQMAGRAGRDHRYPDGEVVFFHYGITNHMVKAKNHIQMMNREGGQG
ncbi:DEAD/DEAH box helicase [Tuberibacillus sp. Marseille-P3662]|uniref:DEAD/DEAH box helicase n=1 Tax=Tuberibacillus sp. Marseille-P3662 TaxID=1965358 RepID=UPI001593A1B4|nr:DEAD/DEAH box helicase [Tuberibacillus sp. Marseille-P3662]